MKSSLPILLLAGAGIAVAAASSGASAGKARRPEPEPTPVGEDELVAVSPRGAAHLAQIEADPRAYTYGELMAFADLLTRDAELLESIGETEQAADALREADDIRALAADLYRVCFEENGESDPGCDTSPGRLSETLSGFPLPLPTEFAPLTGTAADPLPDLDATAPADGEPAGDDPIGPIGPGGLSPQQKEALDRLLEQQRNGEETPPVDDGTGASDPLSAYGYPTSPGPFLGGFDRWRDDLGSFTGELNHAEAAANALRSDGFEFLERTSGRIPSFEAINETVNDPGLASDLQQAHRAAQALDIALLGPDALEELGRQGTLSETQIEVSSLPESLKQDLIERWVAPTEAEARRNRLREEAAAQAEAEREAEERDRRARRKRRREAWEREWGAAQREAERMRREEARPQTIQDLQRRERERRARERAEIERLNREANRRSFPGTTERDLGVFAEADDDDASEGPTGVRF